MLPFAIRTRCAAASLFGHTPLGGRPQVDAGAPCFGQADGDRLLRRAGAVFAFANVMHFFAHEFPGLCACGFALPFVTASPFKCFFLRHNPNYPLTAVRFALSGPGMSIGMGVSTAFAGGEQLGFSLEPILHVPPRNPTALFEESKSPPGDFLVRRLVVLVFCFLCHNFRFVETFQLENNLGGGYTDFRQPKIRASMG